MAVFVHIFLLIFHILFTFKHKPFFHMCQNERKLLLLIKIITKIQELLSYINVAKRKKKNPVDIHKFGTQSLIEEPQTVTESPRICQGSQKQGSDLRGKKEDGRTGLSRNDTGLLKREAETRWQHQRSLV